MFLLNNRDRILKYKSEVIQVNPEITAKVAEMAGCTIEEIELAVERYLNRHAFNRHLRVI